MRSDMSKVIVERPRRTYPVRGSEYPRGRLDNKWWPRFEDAPLIESMGGRYAEKDLNENLRPLARFLRSNVGRPWDKVRSEIAAHLSCTSAVQKHVLDHLRDYVHEHVRVENKAVLLENGFGFTFGTGSPPVLVSRGSSWRFYVCPRTGLLRLAPAVRRKRPAGSEPSDRRVLSDECELRRIDGVWYEIAVAAIPPAAEERAKRVDVLARAPLASVVQRLRDDPLWLRGHYAAAKRQLSKRQLARHGLRSP